MSNALKAVHACRRQVAALKEDDTWRAFLENVTGKRSTRAMSDAELGLVIDRLRHNGAKAKDKPNNKAYLRKIFAIWSEMCRLEIPVNPTRDALRAFVHNMTGVDDPNWLSLVQSQKVVEGLKAWRSRELKKREVPVAGIQA